MWTPVLDMGRDAEPEDWLEDVVTDEASLFVARRDGAVLRIDKKTWRCQKLRPARNEADGTTHRLALDTKEIFSVESFSTVQSQARVVVSRQPKAGGSTRTIALVPGEPADAILGLDGIYIPARHSDTGVLTRVSNVYERPEDFDLGEVWVQDGTTFAGDAYLLIGDDSKGQIGRWVSNGLEVEVEAPRASIFAVDAKSIYWLAAGGLHRATRPGGAPELVAAIDEWGEPQQMVMDGRAVYVVQRWDSRDGSTLKLFRYDDVQRAVTIVLEEESGQHHRIAIDDRNVYLLSRSALRRRAR